MDGLWTVGEEGGKEGERETRRKEGQWERGKEGRGRRGRVRERDQMSEQLTPQRTATAPQHKLRLSASHSLLTNAFLLAWTDSS